MRLANGPLHISVPSFDRISDFNGYSRRWSPRLSGRRPLWRRFSVELAIDFIDFLFKQPCPNDRCLAVFDGQQITQRAGEEVSMSTAPSPHWPTHPATTLSVIHRSISIFSTRQCARCFRTALAVGVVFAFMSSSSSADFPSLATLVYLDVSRANWTLTWGLTLAKYAS